MNIYSQNNSLTKNKMAVSFSMSNKKWLPLPLFLVIVIAQICIDHSNAGSVVEYLPGFAGPLPFQLETGYVGVDEGENVQVFYYFVKSESNPKEDPLLLWISGGPGCSSFHGLIYEFGPIMFEMVEYNGSLPTLLLNPNSWTKMASIIFADLPAETGFTYDKAPPASPPTDLQYVNNAYEFIRKWLSEHPEYYSNTFYLGGDSYSGIPVPVIAQLISDGNEAAAEEFINLKGYILGNPLTYHGQENYQIEFAHGMAIISDELFESLKTSCDGQYQEEWIDPNNTLCLKNLDAYDECFIGLELQNVIEPNCGFDSPRSIKSFRRGRAMDERLIQLYNAKKQSISSSLRCRVDGYKLSYYWANNESVRAALNVRKGSKGKWKRCDRKDMAVKISDVRPYHQNLSKKGYRSLIYCGDHDMVVPHQAALGWIKKLNYSVVDEWRPWRVHGQIAGYTRSYSNNMTFATVKGAGHTAPEYRPEECLGMFKRWISHQPL